MFNLSIVCVGIAWPAKRYLHFYLFLYAIFPRAPSIAW